MIEVKFCGLTRVEDAREAASLGASYAGVIFAGGPRQVAPPRARAILDGAAPLQRVGVFARADAAHIADAAGVARLDVVQLHGDPTPEDVRRVREQLAKEVWAVVRVDDRPPPALAELFDAASAVLLDARVEGALGGTGVAIAWPRVAEAVAAARRGRRMVLAGGLRPENVAAAVRALRPDVVDVSSGVESAPGVKDHARMRAFAAAVSAAGADR